MTLFCYSTGVILLSIIIFFAVSLTASVVGAISGIGGGILIKPVLELVSDSSVEVISFLSGCTVLSMAVVSLLKKRKSDIKLERRRGTFLAVGSAAGGVIGKLIFDSMKSGVLGIWQSLLLFLVTAVLLVFLKVEYKLPRIEVSASIPCLLMGMLLGLVSSFLGIGGGSLNLAVLTYFLGMNFKEASLHSIYVILFSQTASIIMSVVSGKVPEFSSLMLITMIAGGVLGGLVGSIISNRLENKAIERLYAIVLVLVLILSGRNFIFYLI